MTAVKTQMGRRVLIACPAKPGTRYGNRITALRYQSFLRELGHRPRIDDRLSGNIELLIALHASRSAELISQSKRASPERPVVVVVTGTDIYRDGETIATKNSLRLADRIVVLQPSSLEDLPKSVRRKTRVIYQSVQPINMARPQNVRRRRVIVAGHLRPVKDPFRAALAARKLPVDSKIVVHHYGAIIDDGMRKRATAESRSNPRYEWRGEISRSALMRRLATGWLMVLSSKMEGGAAVLSEAIVHGLPVLATRIPGSVGLLGVDYNGYFDVGSTTGLRTQLLRCEDDPAFYSDLQRQVVRRAGLFATDKERKALASLLRELTS